MPRQTIGRPAAPAILTASQVARLTGIGLNYVYTLLRSNQLRGHKVGGVWQIDTQSVVERWPQTYKTDEIPGVTR